MLIDSNSVLFDHVAITSSAVNSTSVPLTSLEYPGHSEPISMFCRVSTAFASGTSLAVKIQESADNSTWSDVSGTTMSLALSALTKGADFGYRFLPKNVSKAYVRLVATPTGTFTAGKLFAAIVREDDISRS